MGAKPNSSRGQLSHSIDASQPTIARMAIAGPTIRVNTPVDGAPASGASNSASGAALGAAVGDGTGWAADGVGGSNGSGDKFVTTISLSDAAPATFNRKSMIREPTFIPLVYHDFASRKVNCINLALRVEAYR